MIGVYIHVPYCRTICPYCDFVKTRTSGEAPLAFTDALLREMGTHNGDRDVDSVFFGGGTPSLLALDDLERILKGLNEFFTLHDVEITLEANPDDVTVEKAEGWRALGVNRVSLGVQSLDDRVLQYLGRRHNTEQAREACRVVSHHFDNWSLDLMFGAKPVDAWRDTVKGVNEIAPPHVSAYGLTYEPGTPFEQRKDDAVDDDTYLDLYHGVVDGLSCWQRYEVSNFAKPGREARHNLRYWRNEGYAGFGPGAVSFLGDVRARNHVDVDEYLADPGGKTEELALSPREICIETVIQHLRLQAGLPKEYYADRFGASVEHDFGAQFDSLIERGLLVDVGTAYQPTPLGFDLNNEIGLALVD
jgi:oxygen-independent coproporphyrinogen-3 oxidase